MAVRFSLVNYDDLLRKMGTDAVPCLLAIHVFDLSVVSTVVTFWDVRKPGSVTPVVPMKG